MSQSQAFFQHGRGGTVAAGPFAARASASAWINLDFMVGSSHSAQVPGIAVLVDFEGEKPGVFQGAFCQAVKLILVLHAAGKPGGALPPSWGHRWCSCHACEHPFPVLSTASAPWGSVFALPGFVPTAGFTLARFLFISYHGWCLFSFSSSEAFGSECL